MTTTGRAGTWTGDPVSQVAREFVQQGDVSWVNDVVVSDLCGCAQEKRDDLYRNVPLDLLDWYCGAGMNTGNFFRWRGIRTSACEEYEYEESLQFDTRDTERLFKNNGMGHSLEDRFLPMGGEYKGAYYMDLNAPKWREVVRQGLLRPAAFGDTITQDNIGVGLPISWGFDRWNMLAFRDWLRQRFAPEQIKGLGVQSLGDLDMRPYTLDLRAKVGPDALWEDPLFREFVKFQYVSNLVVWGQMGRDTKAEAVRLGRPCPAVYGNQCRDIVGLSPFQVAQSRLVDVVWLEISMYQPFMPGGRATATASLVYKVGLASGMFRKPVWNIEYPGAFGNPGGLAGDIVLAEASAQGGLVYLGLSDARVTSYLNFLGRNRALFVHREPYAKVALVYPMSSLLWRTFMPLNRAWSGRQYFCGLARILEDQHVPYEVLIFGHPDLWDDTEGLKRLERYEAIVLPVADCLSDVQVTAVKRFLERGGKVLACGPLAERDQEYRPRPTPALAGAAAKPGWSAVTSAQMDAWLKGKPQQADAPEVKVIEAQVTATVGTAALVSTNAPNTVWISPWLQAGGRRLALHLVNYDLDVKNNAMRPATDIRLQVRLPAGASFDRALLISPDQDTQELKLTSSAGGAEVTVPRLEVYSIVVLTTGEELVVANQLACTRRQLDRLRVATGQPVPQPLAALCSDATTLYERSDHAAALTVVDRALNEATAAVDKAVAANLDTERRTREETVAAATGATKAFDFGAGPVAQGWTGVSAQATYDAKTGFGWLNAAGIRAGGGLTPDALHGDYLGAIGERTFRMDIPDGQYHVTIVTGGPYQYVAASSVKANGEWRLLGERGHAGLFRTRHFSAPATGGHLDLSFGGTMQCDDQGRGYQNALDWYVCGVLVKPAAAEAESASDLLTGGALREWLVSEPTPDETCLAMETVFPVEDVLLGPMQAGTPVPVGDPAAGQAGTRWRLFRAEEAGGFAPVPLDALVGTDCEMATYGLTFLSVPSACKAKLWLGTTGLAVAWLNGREVVRDLVAAGLQADEYQVAVELKAGWNPLLIKVCRFWGHHYAFSVCVTDPDGKPIPGVNISATAGKPSDSLARIYPLELPQLTISAAELDWGSQVTGTVQFRNGTAAPLDGEMSLLVEETNAAAVQITGAEGTGFTRLPSRETLARQFSIALPNPAAGLEYVSVRAQVRVSDRTLTSPATRLWLRQPSVGVSVPSRGLREPPVRVVDDFSAIAEWHPGQAVVQPEADAGKVKEGPRSLKVTCDVPGDGTAVMPTVSRSFAGEDWSGYNTLTYGVCIVDEDPEVKTHRFCVVVYNRDSRGGQQYVVHENVPVGQWVEIEEDITGYFRDDVSSIVPHLYMQDAKKNGRYTFWFSPFRLTRASKSHPEWEDLYSGAPAETIPVFLRIYNPMGAELSGQVAVRPPEGWTVAPQASWPFTAASGKQWGDVLRLTPPGGISGLKVPLTVRVETGTGAFEAPVQIDPPRVAVVPRTGVAPAMDGNLEDACWKNAARVAGFSLIDGTALASQQTEAWVCHDGAKLYVAMQCREAAMRGLRTAVTQRDGPIWEDDSVELFLQPAGLSGYHHILANVLGITRAETSGGCVCNPVCQAVRRADAWTIEITIDLAELGVTVKAGDTWGANFNRTRPAKAQAPTEYSGWSCTYGGFHTPARFGTLLFE